jgi:RHS repeat-associated protein
VQYAYDNDSRLTNLTYRGALDHRIEYTYDALGNVASRSRVLGYSVLPSAVSTGTYNAANQQLTFGTYAMLYDTNGNLTNIANSADSSVRMLAWSARNQLTNMQGAVTAAFGYDGLGRRITRTVSGTTEKYLYDGLNIIQQLDGSGAVGANYFRGLGIDEPWQRSDVGITITNRVYLADALGSVVALADPSENISNTFAYEPFGLTSTTGLTNKNCYEFTGRENDETGLYYLRARYYYPPLERFISQDPLDSLHTKYAYVSDNPLLFTDPTGLTDYNAWQTDQFIFNAYEVVNESGYDAAADLYYGTLGVDGEVGVYDFGENEHSNDRFCVNGHWISASSFGNYIAGFEGRMYDIIHDQGMPTLLPLVALEGLFYHAGRNSRSPDDFWDSTGRPDITAGAQFADHWSDFLGSPLGPKNPPCCPKK